MSKQTDIVKKQRDSELLARRALQVQRGAARAAVLGVNDGLVSVLCIVVAVAAAGAENGAVLLAGFAGLIAGAVSMAAGEWISVQSQVELFQGVLKDLKRLVKNDRELLVEQVADRLSKSGHGDATARKAAAEIGQDDKHLSDVYATQIIGINPDELGSPWIAAGSSFVLFTLGALAPLAPWFLTGGNTGIIVSITLTLIASLIVGGYVARSSGKSITSGAVRQLLIVAFAAVVTYSIGALFGVATA